MTACCNIYGHFTFFKSCVENDIKKLGISDVDRYEIHELWTICVGVSTSKNGVVHNRDGAVNDNLGYDKLEKVLTAIGCKSSAPNGRYSQEKKEKLQIKINLLSPVLLGEAYDIFRQTLPYIKTTTNLL